MGAARKRKGEAAATAGMAEGGRVVTGQPMARRMSAEPVEEEAALLPCCDGATPTQVVARSASTPTGQYSSPAAELTLYTLQPAPATTIADVVETLKVSWPSPPVPTMSQIGPSPKLPTSATWACFCITSAHAATTSGRPSLPVNLSAARKAPIWAGRAPSGAARCSKESLRSAKVKSTGLVTSFLTRTANVVDEYSGAAVGAGLMMMEDAGESLQDG